VNMYAVKEVSCAEILKVLADDTRLSVVRLLMAGPRHVSAINAELNVERTLLSHHLSTLRDAGVVESEREGKHVLYRLASQVESKRHGKVLELGCCRLDFS
jgi:ArsR family transcriptional regulator, nickel/cobalt-responsive transcriptional repressor